jgi:hypothetical protein
MKLRFVFVILFFASKNYAQQIHWQQTKNWRLYDAHSLRGFNNSDEKILAAKNIELNLDSIKEYFTSVKLYTPENNPVWMGNYIVSFQTIDQQTNIIYVSKYGGFIYHSNDHIYYQLEDGDAENLIKYLSSCAELLRNKL